MFSRAISAVLMGIEGVPVYVEADVSYGLPYFDMVGSLASEVKEARERVRTAIRNAGFDLEARKIIVNLSPADLHKSGSSYDLAIAAAVLTAYGLIRPSALDSTLFAGELGLDGSVRPINGVLPIVLTAEQEKIRRCIVPRGNAYEGAAASGPLVYGVSTLREMVEFLNGNLQLQPAQEAAGPGYSPAYGEEVDFSQLRGQHVLKRSLEIAASGRHNLLMVGPPGSGKSMAARRLPSILPALTRQEQLEISRIYSAAGFLEADKGLVRDRPFRSPHHTITASALAGGGSMPRPGEVSLAHRGVLFLDEFTEFDKNAMETLRQPLEEGKITISRQKLSCEFPAGFMLVAAINPCACGYYPDLSKCRCTPLQIQRYIGRISRPLMDRIDLTVHIGRVSIEMLQKKEEEESSARIRERVQRAWEIQKERFKGTGCSCNAGIPGKDMERYCSLGQQEQSYMQSIYSSYGLSARSYHKILKVARTIADLEGADQIRQKHLAEAVFYKSLDHTYWDGPSRRYA